MMNELSLLNTLLDGGFDLALPSLSAPARMAVPDVDVKQTEDAYTLEMDLPGKTENDVELNLKDGVLTISSVTETKTESVEKDKKGDAEKTEKSAGSKADKAEVKWILRERHSYGFKRSFTLPGDVDGENVTASFKNGVLTVIMPRMEAPKAKRIAITAA